MPKFVDGEAGSLASGVAQFHPFGRADHGRYAEAVRRAGHEFEDGMASGARATLVERRRYAATHADGSRRYRVTDVSIARRNVHRFRFHSAGYRG